MIIKSCKIVNSKELFELLNYIPKERVKIEETFFVIDTVYGLVVYESEISNIFLNESAISIVLKNADFNEGRGPMLYDKIFNSFSKAIEYIFTQKGIYGSQQYINNSPGININGKPFCVSSFNGYKIKIDILQ